MRFRGRNRDRLRILLVIACLMFIYMYISGELTSEDTKYVVIYGNSTDFSYAFSGGKCPLPDMKIDFNTLHKFYKKIPPLICDDESWTSAKNGKFIIDHYSIQKHGEIICGYKNYYRVDDFNIKFNFTPHFQSGSQIQGDYSLASCSSLDGTHMDDIIATIIPQKEVIVRSRNTRKPKDSLGINVHILGFDSLSRLAFQRQLKETHKYLVDDLHAAVLEIYNIVGDGTPQAFIPILTGKTEEELPLTRNRFPNANYLDVYPMNAGYATLFHEDMAYISMFGYRLKGFLRQPTDHYSKTLYYLIEKMYGRGDCIGNEAQHIGFLRYAYEFMTKYPKDVPKFGISFHGLLSHDYINKVQVADFDVLNHIQILQREGVLNNTILMVMSDHGHRFAEYRASQQGQLEERLPYFAIIAPKWFRDTYSVAWQNLLDNRARLTTPFDIHATLMHLLHWREPTDANLLHRSLSLFDKIPATRGCAEAKIAAHWCTCLTWQNLPLDDEIAISIARIITEAINNETLRERSLCVKLDFEKLEMAKYQVPDKTLLQYNGGKDLDGFDPDLSAKVNVKFAFYQIRFRTSPGDALYESTVYYDGRYEKIRKIVINLNQVSHINKYGDSPHCIIKKDYFLAKWCVCYDKV